MWTGERFPAVAQRRHPAAQPADDRKPREQPGLLVAQRDELALERLAGPEQQGLDGAQADVIVIGDPLVGPPFPLAEIQDLLMAGAEVLHGPAQEVDLDGVADRLLLTLDRSEVDLGHW